MDSRSVRRSPRNMRFLRTPVRQAALRVNIANSIRRKFRTRARASRDGCPVLSCSFHASINVLWALIGFPSFWYSLAGISSAINRSPGSVLIRTLPIAEFLGQGVLFCGIRDTVRFKTQSIDFRSALSALWRSSAPRPRDVLSASVYHQKRRERAGVGHPAALTCGRSKR